MTKQIGGRTSAWRGDPARSREMAAYEEVRRLPRRVFNGLSYFATFVYWSKAEADRVAVEYRRGGDLARVGRCKLPETGLTGWVVWRWISRAEHPLDRRIREERDLRGRR